MEMFVNNNQVTEFIRWRIWTALNKVLHTAHRVSEPYNVTSSRMQGQLESGTKGSVGSHPEVCNSGEHFTRRS
jgi:hypothetical protein